jgi:hypothetical protein
MGIAAAALAVFGGQLSSPVAAVSSHIGANYAMVKAAQQRAAKAEKQIEVERARRVSGAGTRISAGIIQSLDQNLELRGSKWYGSPGKLGIVQKMLRDVHVAQSLADIYEPLLAATWRFRPASPTPLDREAADFMTWALIERLLWHEILKRTVIDYAAAGFALAEETDAFATIPASRFPLHPGGGLGVLPTGIHQIPSWSVYRWHQSTTAPSQMAGVEQYVQGSDVDLFDIPFVPADRLLRWTWGQEGANFEGLAILRPVYAPWKMKIAFQTLAAIKHERLAIPAPVAIASEEATSDDIDAVEKILQEMRGNERGYLVLDNGWNFKWEGATSNDGSNIEAAISQCNQDIAFNVSAAFMLLGLTGKSGSYALGSTQQGKYHLAELSQSRFIAAGWNIGYDGWSPIERLTRLNYGQDVGIPILEARNLPTANWADRIPLLVRARNAGLIRTDARTENAIREALEFDQYDDESAFDIGGIFGTSTAATTQQTEDADKDEEQPV